MWFALSLLSAFGQALGWALKKKTLENRGVNNTLGAVAYLAAGLALAVMYVFAFGMVLPPLTDRFWQACFMVIGLNVLASWMAYRALDIAPLSFLMPFIALSSLGLIPVEFFLRGTLPTSLQVVGMMTVVVGAIIFSSQKSKKIPLKAVIYFSVTVLCYAVAPAYAAIAVHECGSGLLTACVFHLGVSIGFMGLVLQAKEGAALSAVHRGGELRRVLCLMALSGLVIAFFENGPNTVALEYANASEVMALKRTMPFFALVLGVMMFNEKVTKKHIFGTFLLVTGSILVVWFR